MSKKQYKKGDKKLLNAWAIYDWANSAYPLVISSAVFPIYYGALFFDDLYIELFGFNFKNTRMMWSNGAKTREMINQVNLKLLMYKFK